MVHSSTLDAHYYASLSHYFAGLNNPLKRPVTQFQLAQFYPASCMLRSSVPAEMALFPSLGTIAVHVLSHYALSFWNAHVLGPDLVMRRVAMLTKISVEKEMRSAIRSFNHFLFFFFNKVKYFSIPLSRRAVRPGRYVFVPLRPLRNRICCREPSPTHLAGQCHLSSAPSPRHPH